MIHFRCWHCHRKYTKADAKIGEQFACSCESVLRVPKRDGGNCRVKTVVDHVVSILVCTGGGAFLGFCCAIVLLALVRVIIVPWLVPAFTTAGGLIGLVGGERGIDWMGEMIRKGQRD